MNTVKHLRKLNWRSLPKKSLTTRKQKISANISTAIFASWLGTYLDLLFVGKQYYSFPVRPLETIFSINIAFTIVGLPIVTVLILYVFERISFWKRAVVTILVGLVISQLEKVAEALGWFIHSEQWRHSYSFFGYVLFIMIVWRFYKRR